MQFSFEAPLWQWHGQGAWYFITLPKEYSDAIKEMTAFARRGFGSVRVRAHIAKTEWGTSIFPDSKSGCYLLPVKKSVRQAENLTEGPAIAVQITLNA